MRSRTQSIEPAPESEPEKRWLGSDGRSIPPEVVLNHLSEPASRPPPGSPERSKLVANLEEFIRILEVRGDPLEEPFRVLLSCVRDGLDEEAEDVPEGNQGRRIEVPISTLNEVDLIAWIQDPGWDREDRREMAAELMRREAAGEISPANRGTVRTVLFAFGSG